MKRVLVIGDTGLFGQALMACGQSQGIDIRGVSRHSTDIALDALNASVLEQTFDFIAPSLVINAAGLVDVNRCEQTPEAAWLANARLPAMLSSSCTKRGIRLAHISTDHYYSGDGASPHDEKHPVTFVNEYARTKYAGECMALTCQRSLVIRTNIVGFRGRSGAPTFVEWLLDALEKEIPFELYSDYYTSSISVTQLARAMFQLLDTPASGVLNVACRQGSSKLDFGVALAAACGLATRSMRVGSVKAVTGIRRAESLVLCIDRATQFLAEPLPSIEEVVQQLALEYQERKSSSLVSQ